MQLEQMHIDLYHGNKVKISRMQLTLERMIRAHQQPEYFHHYQLPSGFITTGHVTSKLWGGASATRNIRRFKDKRHNLKITIRYWNKDAHGQPLMANGMKVGTWIYRLDTPVKNIDVERCCLKGQPVVGSGGLQLAVSNIQ